MIQFESIHLLWLLLPLLPFLGYWYRRSYADLSPRRAVLALVLRTLSLALVVLAQVPLMALSNWLSRKPIKRGITRRNQAWAKAQGFLVECLTAIRTVKTQNFATQARWQWLQRYRRFSSEDFQLERLQVVAREFRSAIPMLSRLALMMVGAVLAIQGGTTVGAIFVFMILGGQLANSMLQVASVSDQYQDARAAMDSLADVLGAKPEDSLASSTMLPLPAIAGRIVACEQDGSSVVKVGTLDARRDFTDVRDVVRAYRSLMTDGHAGEVYNVCSGHDRSIRDVADILVGLSTADITLETDPALVRPVDLSVLRGDNTKISDCTGWSPTIPIEQTLEDLLGFWRSQRSKRQGAQT